MSTPQPASKRFTLATLMPGVLVAATGVGAGDLLTASLAGANVGLTLLWAALVGAVLKYVLTEGVARWQMATGQTLLAGWTTHLGRWVQWTFLLYLLIWSVYVGGALINACGVAGTGLAPLSSDPQVSLRLWGFIHALLGAVLVWCGGFALFERVMGVCIGLMFVTVIGATGFIASDWGAILRGAVTPTLPDASGRTWMLGVLGGVGGTVTLLSYGYWIRERGRAGASGLTACRIDLAVGYTLTALFGMCMIIIGSQVSLERGPLLALDLAERIQAATPAIGSLGKYVFLIGFWGAVFSSLLGVWQSVPYLFADFVQLTRGGAGMAPPQALTRTPSYRLYLVFLTLAPLPLLWVSVKQAQQYYAVFGALFMPLLALTLLLMNNRPRWVAREFCNGWLTNSVLAATLAFFGYVLIDKLIGLLAP